MSEESASGNGKAALAPEDEARANLYALIGRLFYNAPDAILLAEICRDDAGTDGEGGVMVDAWRAMRAAAKSAYPVLLKQEHDTLFVGVGRAEVTPYTSHYVREGASGRHLVRLRELMQGWGLARRHATYEVEDHVAGLCDVMRLLILEGRSEDEQRLFFKEFVYPGVIPFLDSVGKSVTAVFYRLVADFARSFIEIERAAMEMERA